MLFKYLINKFLRNITELIEKGLFTSKDLKKEVDDAIKLNIEIIANKLKTDRLIQKTLMVVNHA